jgi:protein-disulfide isomerase
MFWKLTLAAALTFTAMGLTPQPLRAEGTATTAATTAPATTAVPDMVLGQTDAPLTVMEYASYTCPHCANFHDTVFEKFKQNYIDTGKVRFVYREVYFDKYGLWAAMVARCGGDMRYFGISDMLYSTQEDWLASGEDAGIADALRKIGLTAGMNKDQLDACLNDTEMAKAMVSAYQANATADKIEGTPTFIIEGQSYSGEMSYEEFAKILDEKLAD